MTIQSLQTQQINFSNFETSQLDQDLKDAFGALDSNKMMELIKAGANPNLSLNFEDGKIALDYIIQNKDQEIQKEAFIELNNQIAPLAHVLNMINVDCCDVLEDIVATLDRGESITNDQLSHFKSSMEALSLMSEDLDDEEDTYESVSIANFALSTNDIELLQVLADHGCNFEEQINSFEIDPEMLLTAKMEQVYDFVLDRGVPIENLLGGQDQANTIFEQAEELSNTSLINFLEKHGYGNKKIELADAANKV